MAKPRVRPRTPESDPPNERSLNRLPLGHIAEGLILRGMHRRGWT